MALSPPLPADDGEDDDTHFCLRCRRTIRGLDAYVRHRKEECAGACSKPALPERSPPPDLQQQQLRADDFFSQLELQSSSKTSAKTAATRDAPPPAASAVSPAKTPAVPSVPRRMLTRSRSSGSTPATATELPRAAARRIRTVTKGGDEDADEAQTHPPRTHTGGKWRPQQEAPDANVKENIWRRWRAPSPAAAATPPPSAGGKWGPPRGSSPGPSPRPSLVAPPPTHTGGKWKPCYAANAPGGDACDDEADSDGDDGDVQDHHDVPPPGHTRGKWAPGMAGKVRAVLLGSAAAAASVRKSGSEVQYWCGSCNRRLASSKMYERHLQSDLHSRRTLPERQLEAGMAGESVAEPGPRQRSAGPSPKELRADSLRGPVAADPVDSGASSGPGEQRRGLRHGLERCPVCRARVLRHQVGKHLVSHFHWRSTRAASSAPLAVGSAAADLVLDNIEAVVRQSPFQCGLCKFYCNTSQAFRDHWASTGHRRADREVEAGGVAGQYWCSPCEVGCPTTDLMETHLWSEAHREVEAAVNRSVAIVVTRRTALRCRAPGCSASFRYNAQLARHERLCEHRGAAGRPDLGPSTASDRYQARFRCAVCGALRRSRLSLQKHKLKCHSQAPGCYFCSVCSLDFSTATSAAEHRLGQAHRDAVRDRREAVGVLRPLRRCPHCRWRAHGLAELRRHVEDMHPDRKHRCALCGLAFTLPQEVSRHHRRVHAAAAAAAAAAATDTAGPPTPVVLGDDEEPPFGCRLCGFSTDSRAEFIFHQVLHGPAAAGAGDSVREGAGDAPDRSASRGRYRCPVCTKLYRKVALRAHLHVHTGERPFRCGRCDKSFSRKDSCVTHELTAHPSRPPEDEDGDDALEQERQLQHAILSIAPFAAPAQRPGTGRRPVPAVPPHPQRPPDLRDQDQARDRERKHLCDVCGKCFFNKRTLRQHQVSLHGVKPQPCPRPGCAHRARSVAELRAHEATHASGSERRGGFECGTCHFQARTRALLRRHEKIHSGEKAYRCEFEHCHFATRVSSHLVRHRRLHTGAKPYCCPHCSHRCNNLENLRKHVLNTNKHPGKFMYECRFCAGDAVDAAADAGDDAEQFKTNLAADFKTHLALAHPERFRSVAAAATFVAGIYDKAADQDPGDQALVLVKPRKVRGERKSQQAQAAAAILAMSYPGVPGVPDDAAAEEDVPTSLLPKHALLDAELFPVVVADLADLADLDTDSPQPQDVVYIQLEGDEGDVVVLEN